MRETWVWALGWEGSLEKGNTTHSSVLAWRIPWTIESMGSQRVPHDWVNFTSLQSAKANSVKRKRSVFYFSLPTFPEPITWNISVGSDDNLWEVWCFYPLRDQRLLIWFFSAWPTLKLPFSTRSFIFPLSLSKNKQKKANLYFCTKTHCRETGNFCIIHNTMQSCYQKWRL